MNKTVSEMLPSGEEADTKAKYSFPIPIPVAAFLQTLTGLSLHTNCL